MSTTHKEGGLRTKSDFAKKVAYRIGTITFISSTFTGLVAKVLVYLYDIKGDRNKFDLTYVMFGEDQVIDLMYEVFIFEGLKNLALDFFDLGYLKKLYDRRKAIRSNGKNIAQEEAHELFEGVELEMEVRYGSLISCMLMTAFYCGIFPLALIINIILLFLKYWTDKYIFLRRAARPPYLANQIQKAMINKLEGVSIWYIWGYLFLCLGVPFSYDFDSDHPEVQDACKDMLFALIVLYLMTLPVTIIFIYFPSFGRTKRYKAITAKPDYSIAKSLFHTDYELENPIYKDRAVEEMIKTAKMKKSQNNVFKEPGLTEVPTDPQTSP